MDQLREIISKKPLLFLGVSIGYLVVVGLLKWRIQPPIDALYYLVGGLIGIYFLDMAEVFFKLSPSPFRSIIFVVGFAIVSFFITSSSDSLLGKGLVLTLYLTLLLWQVGEWQLRGNLDSWYTMVAGGVRVQMQQWILVGFVCLFLFETYLFVQ